MNKFFLKKLKTAGFEPAPSKRLQPESSASDQLAIFMNVFLLKYSFVCIKTVIKKMTKYVLRALKVLKTTNKLNLTFDCFFGSGLFM